METLDARQTQALFMILAGETYTYIADELDVSERTVRRWAKEPAFRAALRQEIDGVAEIDRLQTHVLLRQYVEKGLDAAQLLHFVQNTERYPLRERMHAAGQLMNHAFKTAVYIQKQPEPEASCLPAAAVGAVVSESAKAASESLERTIAAGRHAASAASTGQNRTKADMKPAASAAPSSNVPKVPPAPQPLSQPDPQAELLEKVVKEVQLETRAEMAKADKTDSHRTSEAENRARRERLERIDKELEAREEHQTPVLSPKSLRAA
jgi:hypothetical protein